MASESAGGVDSPVAVSGLRTTTGTVNATGIHDRDSATGGWHCRSESGWQYSVSTVTSLGENRLVISSSFNFTYA